MTRDDIIRMAREVGFVAYGEDAGEYRIPTPAFHSRLERFAALVAAAEREACIALCKEHSEEYTTFYQHAAAGSCEAMAQSIQKRGKV